MTNYIVVVFVQFLIYYLAQAYNFMLYAHFLWLLKNYCIHFLANEHFPKARVPVNTQLQKKNTIDGMSNVVAIFGIFDKNVITIIFKGDDGNSQETHNQAELKQSINTPKDSSKGIMKLKRQLN